MSFTRAADISLTKTSVLYHQSHLTMHRTNGLSDYRTIGLTH